MGWIRLTLRLPLIAACTLALYLAGVTVRLGALVARARFERADRAIYITWGTLVRRLLGVRLVVEGPRPARPFFLVTNHLSYVDVLVLAGELGCIFVARGDLARWPVFGRLARHGRAIFIDRSRPRDTARVNERLREMLDRGVGLHVFAEGGISPDATVQPFRPPLLQPAIDRGMPVQLGVLTYRTPPGRPSAREAVHWGSDKSFLRSCIDVLRLRRATAVLRFASEPFEGDDRKELAARLTEEARRLFEPLE